MFGGIYCFFMGHQWADRCYGTKASLRCVRCGYSPK